MVGVVWLDGQILQIIAAAIFLDIFLLQRCTAGGNQVLASFGVHTLDIIVGRFKLTAALPFLQFLLQFGLVPVIEVWHAGHVLCRGCVEKIDALLGLLAQLGGVSGAPHLGEGIGQGIEHALVILHHFGILAQGLQQRDGFVEMLIGSAAQFLEALGIAGRIALVDECAGQVIVAEGQCLG